MNYGKSIHDCIVNTVSLSLWQWWTTTSWQEHRVLQTVSSKFPSGQLLLLLSTPLHCSELVIHQGDGDEEDDGDDDDGDDHDEQHPHLPLGGQPCKGGGGHSDSSPSNSSSSLVFFCRDFFPPRLPNLSTSPDLPRFARGERLITSPKSYFDAVA